MLQRISGSISASGREKPRSRRNFTALRCRSAATGLKTRLFNTAHKLRNRGELLLAFGQQRLVHLAQLVVGLPETGSRGDQHGCDPIDVSQPHVRGLDRVAAKHLSIYRWIDFSWVIFSAKAQRRVIDLSGSEPVQLWPLIVAVLSSRDDPVAPVDSE